MQRTPPTGYMDVVLSTLTVGGALRAPLTSLSMAVPQCTPVPRAGLGLVLETSTLHTELAPGNTGCSQLALVTPRFGRLCPSCTVQHNSEVVDGHG